MRLHTIATGSHGNCYVLDNGENKLILDCGQNVKWNDVLLGIGWDITSVDACLFTHKHLDHLGHVSEMDKSGISMYGCNELHDFDNRVIGIGDGHLIKICHAWRVLPWYVPHTGNGCEAVPCFAYYIETWDRQFRMVYITDFLYSPLTFRNLKCNTILIACNHDDVIEDVVQEKYRHIVSGHSSLSTVNDIIDINKTDQLRNVILCHMSDENATPEIMYATIKETVGYAVEVNIACRGLTINLN